MDYPSPHHSRSIFFGDPDDRSRSIETRISHFEDLKPFLKDCSYGDGLTSILVTEETMTDRQPTHRKSDSFKTLIDRLSVKKEKQGNLLKYYQSLEHQLSENYRISVIELNSKRNELISSIDSILEVKIESLRKAQLDVLSKLRSYSNQVTVKQEEVQGLIDTFRSKIAEDNHAVFADVVKKAKKVLDEEVQKPQASYENVKLEVSNFDCKVINSCAMVEASCQTKDTKKNLPYRHQSMMDFKDIENKPTVSIGQVHSDDVRVPFLGINRTKVYLPDKHNTFVVVSYSLKTTVSELLHELTDHLGLNSSNYSLQITTKGLKEAAKLNHSQRLSSVTHYSAILLLTKNNSC